MPARCAAERPDSIASMIVIVCGHGQPALLAQELAQRDAGEVLHDEVRHVAVLALVEHVHDVRVGEAGGRAGLLDEPALEHGVVAQMAVHHLERDTALETQIGRDVHGRHPAARDARANPVPAVDETADQRVRLLTRAHAESLRTRACEDAERLTPRDRNVTVPDRVSRAPRATRAPAAPTSRTRRGRPRSAPPAPPA